MILGAKRPDTTRKRFLIIALLLQGDGAADSIARALGSARAARPGDGCDHQHRADVIAHGVAPDLHLSRVGAVDLALEGRCDVVGDQIAIHVVHELGLGGLVHEHGAAP
jgi:hypothetical protein